MKNKIQNWKEVPIKKIFEEIEIAKSCDFGSLNKGNLPFIGRTRENNGLQGHVESDEIIKGNCITISMVGTFRAFWQAKDFVASQNILCLRNDKLNKYSSLFLCTLLNKLIENKYSYNRPIQKNKILDELLKIPYNNEGNIDFEYMEKFIQELKCKPIKTTILYKELKIETKNWNEFSMSKLFDFVKGKRLIKADMIDGNINFLGAISNNNGVRQKIQAELSELNPPNCITVNYNGSVGEAFYQSEPFLASDDVNILYSKNWEMNKYIALFIITIIKLNRYKFSYGRKWTLEKMKESTLKLPSKNNGNPDFEYMENYIKSLMYSDRI